MYFRSVAACSAPVKTPFEYEVLEIVRGLGYFGTQKLALDILKVLLNHVEDEFTAATEGIYPDEEA
jgi:hypothetical protein